MDYHFAVQKNDTDIWAHTVRCDTVLSGNAKLQNSMKRKILFLVYMYIGRHFTDAHK